MSRSANLSASEVKAIVADSADAAKPAAKLPSWGDIKDGFKAIVKENADGTCEANVPLDPSTEDGRKAMGLLQEMYRPAWRAEGERAQEVRGRRAQVKVRADGKERKVPEQFAEIVERRKHVPRIGIVHPGLPWKKED